MINDGPISAPLQPEVSEVQKEVPKAPPIAPPMGLAKATRHADKNLTPETIAEVKRLTNVANNLKAKIKLGDANAASEYDKLRKTHKENLTAYTHQFLDPIDEQLKKLNLKLELQIKLIDAETERTEARLAELPNQITALEKQKEKYATYKGAEVAVKKIDEKLISLRKQHVQLNEELKNELRNIEDEKNKITDQITKEKSKQTELNKQKAQYYALSNVFSAIGEKKEKKKNINTKAEETRKAELNFKEWIEKGPLNGIYLENLKTFLDLTSTEEVIARCTALVNVEKRNGLGFPALSIDEILSIAAGYIFRPERAERPGRSKLADLTEKTKYYDADPLKNHKIDDENSCLLEILKDEFYKANPAFNPNFVAPLNHKIIEPSLNDDKEIIVPDTNPSTIQNNQEDPITIKQPPVQKNESNTIEVKIRNTVDTSQSSQNQLSNVLLRDMQLARAELRNVVNVIAELESNTMDDNTALSDEQLLQQALMKLQSFKITIEEERTQLKHKFEELTQELGQTKHQMQQKIDETQQEINNTKQAWDETQRELTRTKEQFSKNQQELTEKLNQTKQSSLKTKEQFFLSKLDLDNIKKELGQKKLTLGQAQQELNETTQKLDQTKFQLGNTQQELDLKQQELRQNKQQLDHTQQELNQFKQQQSQTLQELNRMKQQWSQTQLELNQTKQQQSQTLQELNQAKQYGFQIQQELNQAKQHGFQIQQELNQAKQYGFQIQQELNQAKQQQSHTLQELNQTQQAWVNTRQELNLNQQHLSQMQQQFNQTQLQLGQTQHVATQTQQELIQTKEQLVEALKLSPQQILQKEGLKGLGHAIFVYKKENRDTMPTPSILNQWGMATGLARDSSWRAMISQAAALVKQYEDSIKNTPTQPQPAKPQALSPVYQQKSREEQDIFIKLNQLLNASNSEIDGLDQLVKSGYVDVLPLLRQKQNERDSLKMNLLTEEMKNLNELIKNGSKDMIPLLNQKQQEQNWLANEIKKRKI